MPVHIRTGYTGFGHRGRIARLKPAGIYSRALYRESVPACNTDLKAHILALIFLFWALRVKGQKGNAEELFLKTFHILSICVHVTGSVVLFVPS